MATSSERQQHDEDRRRERNERDDDRRRERQATPFGSQESTMKSAGMRYGSTSALSEEARRAVTGAFDAMSEWRDEVTSTTERCTDKVLDRVGEAAKAMGWPREFVDASRSQFQQASRMQAAFIDQMMDAWQQQVRSPGNPMQALSGSAGLGGMTGFGAGAPGLNMAMAPLQMWMQAAEMWQKSWQAALSRWMEAQSGATNGDRDRDRDRDRRRP
jgi:hypothetical protein